MGLMKIGSTYYRKSMRHAKRIALGSNNAISCDTDDHPRFDIEKLGWRKGLEKGELAQRLVMLRSKRYPPPRKSSRPLKTPYEKLSEKQQQLAVRMKTYNYSAKLVNMAKAGKKEKWEMWLVAVDNFDDPNEEVTMLLVAKISKPTVMALVKKGFLVESSGLYQPNKESESWRSIPI